MRHLFALFIIIFLLSCVEKPKINQELAHVGWVRFHGEFLLYQNKKDFIKDNYENCISGAFPLSLQNSYAKKFDGKKVKISGRLVSWKLPNELAMSLNHDGSPITNICGGKTILFADKFELVN